VYKRPFFWLLPSKILSVFKSGRRYVRADLIPVGRDTLDTLARAIRLRPTGVKIPYHESIGVTLAAGLASAHEGSDPLAVWYRSLTTADGKSCCAIHDCAPAEARMKEGHWEVLIFPYNADYARWFPVPDHAVLRRENPDGRPIVCRTPNGFIRCFVPPPGS